MAFRGALRGVPRGSAVRRNGTEAVPYSDFPCLQFPDTLNDNEQELARAIAMESEPIFTKQA